MLNMLAVITIFATFHASMRENGEISSHHDENLESDANGCDCLKPAESKNCDSRYGPLLAKLEEGNRTRCSKIQDYRKPDEKRKPRWCYVSKECPSAPLAHEQKCKFRDDVEYEECAFDICQCLPKSQAQKCSEKFGSRFENDYISTTGSWSWCYTSLKCADANAGVSDEGKCKVRRQGSAWSLNFTTGSVARPKSNYGLPHCVYLKSHPFKKFLSSGTGFAWAGERVNAMRDEAKDWEKFWVDYYQGGITLKANSCNKFVGAEESGELWGTRWNQGPWEKFIVEWNDDQTVSFKSGQWGYYVKAHKEGWVGKGSQFEPETRFEVWNC